MGIGSGSQKFVYDSDLGDMDTETIIRSALGYWNQIRKNENEHCRFEKI